MQRIPIPSELKRTILVEAGHRCAIPTCRFPTTEIAHIVPYSQVQTHTYENLIALCPNCHTRYDNGEIDRKSIIQYKKKLVYLSDRFTKYELDVLEYLRKNNKVIVYGFLSIKNLLDNNLVKNGHTIVHFTYMDGSIELQEFVVVLTEEGNKFINKWIDPEDKDFIY